MKYQPKLQCECLGDFQQGINCFMQVSVAATETEDSKYDESIDFDEDREQ